MKEAIIKILYDDKLEPLEDIMPEMIRDAFDEPCRMNRLKLPEFELLKNSQIGFKKSEICGC